MAREFISPDGLRLDGRRPQELRQIKARMGVFERTDGSAYLEQGNTKVLVVVHGPHEPTSRNKLLHDRCIVKCEYSTATFSTTERSKRSKGDRRRTEVGIWISQTFEAAIMTQLYPRSLIDINVQILQADGGETAAAINCATLALMDAGVAMREFVCSCTTGYIDGTALLDINYLEGGTKNPELCLGIMPKSEKIVLTQMRSRIHADQFEGVMALGIEGCKKIFTILHDVVLKHTESLASSLGT
eukprot:m.19653 g.19653  ORF g.19653 m.19653 type:complete len:244 (+) comp12283_c1_seq1:101-832(+)